MSAADHIPRAQFYSNLAATFPSVLAPTRDPVSSMANAAARLYHSFVKHFGADAVNWCGFYVIRDVIFTDASGNIDHAHSNNANKKRKADAVEAESKETTAVNPEQHDEHDVENKALVLGPFHGLPAVPIIHCGKGVCGTCWQDRTSQVIQDVHSHPNHIACDERSKSEIVIPVFADAQRKKLVALLDIDSPVVNGFGEEDRVGLEILMQFLGEHAHWKYTHPIELSYSSKNAEITCSLSHSH